MNEIKIRKTRNGFIIEYFDELNKPAEWVLEERPEDIYSNDSMIQNNLTVTQNLLWSILEVFGVNYSKHNKNNIIVKIEGDDSDD